jgi:carotenoid cleavage dioxygenase-like enzyme
VDDHLCVYHVASPDGKLSRDYPVDISRGQMMHDFAITENFAVFLDSAVVFDPVHMVTNDALPFRGDFEQPCRVGLLSRKDPEAPMQWFAVRPFAFFHTANAWEDGNMVHLVLCRYSLLPAAMLLRCLLQQCSSVVLLCGCSQQGTALLLLAIGLPLSPEHCAGSTTWTSVRI